MYINFHAHSTSSEKDALPEPRHIAKINKEMGNDKFCITDHGNISSFVQAYVAADNLGMQFIPGIEYYLIPEAPYWTWSAKHNDEVDTVDYATKYHHIVAIAKNQEGVKSLIKIYNNSKKHYGKLCVTRDDLFNNSEGLIVTTACVAGEVPYFIINGQIDKAREIMKLYKDKFGDDYYCELQYHNLGFVDEKKLYNTLVGLAKELDIKMLPTTDSHFSRKEDVIAHDIYKYIFYNGKQAPYDFRNHKFPSAFSGEGYYIKNEEEIRETMRNIPALTDEDIDTAIKNSVELAERCEKTHFPKAKELVDKTKELRSLVEAGFKKKREGTKYAEESRKRIEFEFKTITEMGFTEYFINVYTIIKRAEMLGILVGPGRGCFLPDNRVSTIIGKIKIKDIEPGTSVIGGDGEYHSVLNVHKYNVENEECVKIILSNGSTITCTADHKILREDDKYVDAQLLKEGDVLKGYNNDSANIKINSISKFNYSGNVYDLNVSEVHNYHIEGVTVHNSGPGSEINFLLGITQVDPIENNLIFERFLNPSRWNYPDIDLDIQTSSKRKGYTGKDIVLESLSHDKFPFSGQIQNEVRMTTLTGFKYLAKAFGISYQDINKITTDATVADVYMKEDEYSGWLEEQLTNKHLEYDYRWQEFEKYLWFCYKYGGHDTGDKAHGLIWNRSIHASGVILYPYNDKNILPKSPDGGVIYKGHDLEKMGYIKYDLLSLDALNAINEFMPKIEKDTGKPFDWEDTFDKATWETFQDADTNFVFQFSSNGMKRALKTVKPDSIDTLAELNSLYRPGCINAGIFDRYLAEEWSDEEKIVGEFLKEEFGEQHAYAMIFQEDIMRVVQKMAGFTLAEADLVRRAMSRKEADTMNAYKKQFIENFDTKKYGNIAEFVWNTIEVFATYTFNRCLVGDTKVKKVSSDALNKILPNGNISKELTRMLPNGNILEDSTIKNLYEDIQKGEEVFVACKGSDNKVVINRVKNVFKQGEHLTYKIVLSSGHTIVATGNHKFQVKDGTYKTVDQLIVHEDELLYCNFEDDIIVSSSVIDSITVEGNNNTYDVEIDSKEHNFFANGICSHNSHAVAYSEVAYWTAYLFTHYKDEYLQYLMNTNSTQRNQITAYLSNNSYNIVYPSLVTRNTKWVVYNNQILIPTLEVQEDKTVGKYLLSLNAAKNKMIVKYGVLDSQCPDRKNLRDLFKELDKRKLKALTSVQLDRLYEIDDVKELISNLAALDFLDFEPDDDKDVYHITVKKARSEKEVDLSFQLNEEILQHNAQEDIRAYGIARDAYCDTLEGYNYDAIDRGFAEFLAKVPLSMPIESLNLTQKNVYFKKYLDKLYYPIYRTINEPKRTICKSCNIYERWGKAVLVFSNCTLEVGIMPRLLKFFKGLSNNTPITVTLKMDTYFSKEGTLQFRTNVIGAAERGY